jgi:hypothetical protein
MATADLEARLRELNKRKLEVDAAIKEQEKVAKRASKSARKTARSLPSLLCEFGATTLTEASSEVIIPPELAAHKDKQVLLAIFCLSGHCVDAAVSWLLGQGRSKSELVQCDAAVRERAAAGIEWLYIDSSPELLTFVFDSLPEQIYGLGRYVVEHRLFQWLVDQNCLKGAAPKYKQFLHQAVKSLPDAMPAVGKAKLLDFFLRNNRATRHWIVSFRQRWWVKPGMLGAGETFDPDVLQRRVPWQHKPSFRFLHVCGPGSQSLIFCVRVNLTI